MKVLAWLFSIILIAMAGYLVYFDRQDAGEIATLTVPLMTKPNVGRVEEAESEALEGETLASEGSAKSCYVWGSFSEAATRQIAPRLRERGLDQSMTICDEFLPEKYIVFLGPLENHTSLRAFAKQLRQQGYKKVRPIQRGVLAPGLEIAEFDNAEQAAAYIESGKAPEISGIRVVQRLGEPSGRVNLLFQALEKSQAEKLERLSKDYKATTLKACPKN